MSTTDTGSKPLPHREEQQLFQAAQAGCRRSLNRLMAAYEGAVRSFIDGQGYYGLSREEAHQVGREGLWQALLTYPPDSPEPFWSLRWGLGGVGCAVLLAGQRQRWHRRWAGPHQTALSDEPDLAATDPAQALEAQRVEEVLAEMVAALPERQQQVLVAYYGLDGRPPTTYRQLGRELGYSHTRIWQLHHEALARLSHPGRSYRLRTLLGRQNVAEYLQAHRQVKRWLHRRGCRRPQEVADA